MCVYQTADYNTNLRCIAFNHTITSCVKQAK